MILDKVHTILVGADFGCRARIIQHGTQELIHYIPFRHIYFYHFLLSYTTDKSFFFVSRQTSKNMQSRNSHSYWVRFFLNDNSYFMQLKCGFCKKSFVMNVPLVSWAYLSSLLGGFAVAPTSVQPKPGFGIGNRSQGLISVSVSEPIPHTISN